MLFKILFYTQKGFQFDWSQGELPARDEIENMTYAELLKFAGGTETRIDKTPQQEEPLASSAWDSTSVQCEQSQCVATNKNQSRKTRGQGTAVALNCSAPSRNQTAEDDYRADFEAWQLKTYGVIYS